MGISQFPVAPKNDEACDKKQKYQVAHNQLTKNILEYSTSPGEYKAQCIHMAGIEVRVPQIKILPLRRRSTQLCAEFRYMCQIQEDGHADTARLSHRPSQYDCPTRTFTNNPRNCVNTKSCCTQKSRIVRKNCEIKTERRAQHKTGGIFCQSLFQKIAGSRTEK